MRAIPFAALAGILLAACSSSVIPPEQDGTELWLAAGVYTSGNGDAFSKVHRAFVNNATQGFDYSAFTAESLNNNGYAWPQSTDIWAQITEYLPWVLVGIICVILAIALVMMARKGDI